MKRSSFIVVCLCIATPALAELSLKEIRTASNDVLVAFFKSTKVDAKEVNIADLSAWKLNGQPVKAIHKYVMQADACDHHIYLEVPRLVNGTKYTLQTPHGDSAFVFNDHTMFCESIKTNQSAYSALCKSNYALFAIWLGDGGSRQIGDALPTYEVFEVVTSKTVATGTLTQVGADASSGDFVYRINLSAVPEGGPYKIAVKGYGCSYPFGVGGDFSRRLAYTIMRGQYYQRCGWPGVAAR